MYWFSIFAQVIPKYQLKIDNILLNDKEIIQQSIKNGNIASDTLKKLFNLYMNFQDEYNLHSMQACGRMSEQLKIDIKDTELYFSNANNQCLWSSDPGSQTSNVLNVFTDISDFVKYPIVIIIIALFLPLFVKYGIKIIKEAILDSI